MSGPTDTTETETTGMDTAILTAAKFVRFIRRHFRGVGDATGVEVMDLDIRQVDNGAWLLTPKQGEPSDSVTRFEDIQADRPPWAAGWPRVGPDTRVTGVDESLAAAKKRWDAHVDELRDFLGGDQWTEEQRDALADRPKPKLVIPTIPVTPEEDEAWIEKLRETKAKVDAQPVPAGGKVWFDPEDHSDRLGMLMDKSTVDGMHRTIESQAKTIERLSKALGRERSLASMAERLDLLERARKEAEAMPPKGRYVVSTFDPHDPAKLVCRVCGNDVTDTRGICGDGHTWDEVEGACLREWSSVEALAPRFVAERVEDEQPDPIVGPSDC